MYSSHLGVLRLRASGIYGNKGILAVFLVGGCSIDSQISYEFKVLPRSLGKRIDAFSRRSSSRVGFLMIVARGSFLKMLKSPSKDSLLLSTTILTKGLGSLSDGNPSLGYGKLLNP